MRYDITNIPVAEVFEERDGCPICRLRDQLEQRVVEYITGAAMMVSYFLIRRRMFAAGTTPSPQG